MSFNTTIDNVIIVLEKGFKHLKPHATANFPNITVSIKIKKIVTGYSQIRDKPNEETKLRNYIDLTVITRMPKIL